MRLPALCLLSCFFVPLVGLGASTAAAQEPATDGGIEVEKLFEPREFESDGQVLKYRLLKPLHYDADKHYPLVVFLHGAGERGSDNVAQLVHGAKEFCTPHRREDFPCYVLAPQCPENERWADVDWLLPEVQFPERASESMTLVLKLIDQMLETANIDERRVYVTGLSMGGYGTWDALARRPNLFAAAVPICGGGDTATAGKIAHVPIRCFHGGADNVVVPEKSRRIVAAIKAENGADIEYTEYEGVGHNSWTQTYAQDDLYDWLFAQKKGERRK